MNGRPKKNFEIISLCLFVFLLMPLVKMNSTMDMELAPRFLLLGLFVFIASVYILTRKETITLFSNPASKFFLIWILILAWMAFTIIWSVNPGDALAEWFRLLLIGSFGLISYRIVRSSDDSVVYIFRGASLAVIIFSFYGIIQIVTFWNSDPGMRTSLANKVVSSLTNKNFFSEALVLLLPLQLAGLFTDSRKFSLITIPAIILNLSFIIFLQSTAAWISVFVSSLLFLILLSKNKHRSPVKLFGRNKKWMYASIVFILIISSAFVIKSDQHKLILNKINRAVEYASQPELISTYRPENNNSVFERIIIWRNSFKMISDHPVLGAGLNNWKLFNPSYGLGGTQFINSGLLNYEHPHNDYLLIWAEQGPVGLILYFILLIILFRTGFTQLKKADGKDYYIIALILSGITSFLILSFFGYPRSRIYPILILMIFAVLLLNYSDKSPTGRKMNVNYIWIIIAISSIPAMYAAYSRINGEIHIKRTKKAQGGNNFDRMIRETDRAYSWFFPLDLTATPVSWYRGMARFYSKDYQHAIEEYENALKINPFHLRVLNDLATTYERTGNRKKAIMLYKESLRITPLFIEGNLNLSAAYFNSNNIDSSYYYIDKVYGLPMNMSDQRNYDQFLGPILSAKIFDDMVLANDTNKTRRLSEILEDENRLKQLYKQSKLESQPFAKILNTLANEY